MGVLRSTESFKAEVEELREMLLLQQQGILNDKDDAQRPSSLGMRERGAARKYKLRKDGENITSRNDQGIVCVTSGVSFLGFAIVNCLLARGYTVRILLDTQEDLEKVREMEMFGSNINDAAEAVVVADMMDVNMLIHAFQGCSCIFHPSAFADPTGVSGYSKHMAEIEARTAELVIEACVRTQTVKKCVFTSSLLSCIWRRPHNHNRLTTIVDENCWTDENLCRDKKLWYALGKTMAEKAAWRAARGRDLKLVTMCPGLIVGPGFRRRSSTASIAYLKGAQDMLREGLLATVNVNKLAEAHVCVYESMGRTACGRYICFDHVIRRAEDAVELERQLGIPNRISLNSSRPDEDQATWFELSKRKLSRLMPSSRRCSYDILY